jgi:hypothetical protein
LQGNKADLVCKLNDMNVKVPEAPAEPEPTVLGLPAKNVTPVELPKAAAIESKKAQPKAAEAKAVEPATPWQEVVCHIGKDGGSMKGKKLGEIIPTTRAAKQIPSIEKFFADAEKSEEFSPEDKAKIPALAAAAREGIKAWQIANNPPAEPEKEKAAAKAAEAQQQPTTEQGWHDFLIESKDATLNGKKMRELTVAQMNFIGDWIAKVDMKAATPYQKKLAANYALCKASTGSAEPELPAHVRELDKRLKDAEIEPDKFLAEMKLLKELPDSYTSITQVTPEEAEGMFANWESVKEACDTIDV